MSLDIRKSTKLVKGYGVKGVTYPTYADGEVLQEYLAWKDMLSRCTEKYWVKYPTYIGTSCSENFKSYSFFYEWCQEQIGFGNIDEKGKSWHLDKDILLKGNKTYSETTCCFIPHRVNSLFVSRRALRGNFPIGVNWSSRDNVFLARCCIGGGKQINLGSFSNVKDAFMCYKIYKESLIKEEANRYKSKIDGRVYAALIGYEVSEQD